MTPRGPGVVFDLDGTLVDSEPHWAWGFSTGLSETLARRGHGRHGIDPDRMAHFRGGRVPDSVRAIIETLDLTLPDAELDAVVDEVIARVSARFVEDPRPIAEAVATARALAADGIPLAVASSSAPPFIDAALDRLGLAELIPVRVSAIGLPQGKPDPTVYLIALDRLAVRAAGSVAIEDSTAGVGAAVNAGMRCVWFAPEPDATPPDRVDAGALGVSADVDLDSVVTWTRHLDADVVRDLLGDHDERPASR